MENFSKSPPEHFPVLHLCHCYKNSYMATAGNNHNNPNLTYKSWSEIGDMKSIDTKLF